MLTSLLLIVAVPGLVATSCFCLHVGSYLWFSVIVVISCFCFPYHLLLAASFLYSLQLAVAFPVFVAIAYFFCFSICWWFSVLVVISGLLVP